MAKPNFGFEKRQRELEKKRKKEEKLQRKLDRKNPPSDDETVTPGEGET
ncbi:hypothetical protein H0Z60_07335 [Ectothiorhodospiraceae bacterium WFHF3C12]|nr:hypothetical protein [Ectothiorhodospiraceae bacterium WFHF3C12]